MLRAIMSSIFSMSASSSATEAKPALLTIKVMLGSSFSFVSTFARSSLLLTSATNRPMRCQLPSSWLHLCYSLSGDTAAV
jgi:hypothetical protein